MINYQLKSQSDKQAKEFKLADAAEKKSRMKYDNALEELNEYLMKRKDAERSASASVIKNLDKEISQSTKKVSLLKEEANIACHAFNQLNERYFNTDLPETFKKYHTFNSDVDFYVQLLFKHLGTVERSLRDLASTNNEDIQVMVIQGVDYGNLLEAKVEGIRRSSVKTMSPRNMISSQSQVKLVTEVEKPPSDVRVERTSLTEPPVILALPASILTPPPVDELQKDLEVKESIIFEEWKAIYDFVAEEDNEISIFAGQIVFVQKGQKLSTEHEVPSDERSDDWIWIRLQDERCGYVPFSFIEPQIAAVESEKSVVNEQNDENVTVDKIKLNLGVIPKIYSQCIASILVEGITVEGAFRVSGSLRNCKDLKRQYEKSTLKSNYRRTVGFISSSHLRCLHFNQNVY